MSPNTSLDITTPESWLWEAACVMCGPIDAPKYNNYTLPFMVGFNATTAGQR